MGGIATSGVPGAVSLQSVVPAPEEESEVNFVDKIFFPGAVVCDHK